MTLAEKRALLTKLNVRTNAKINRYEKKGIHVKDTRYDFSVPKELIGRYSNKQLDNAINKQLDFTSRSKSFQFERGKNGQAITKADWNRFKAAEKEYNRKIDEMRDIPGKKSDGTTIAEYLAKKNKHVDRINTSPDGFYKVNSDLTDPSDFNRASLKARMKSLKKFGTVSGLSASIRKEQQASVTLAQNKGRPDIAGSLKGLSTAQFGKLNMLTGGILDFLISVPSGGSEEGEVDGVLLQDWNNDEEYLVEQIRHVQKGESHATLY